MWEYIQSAMEDRMMRALTIFIACTSAIAIVAAAAYCGHAFGFSHGVESAWNGVQATCEDPEAQTKTNCRHVRDISPPPTEAGAVDVLTAAMLLDR